MENSFIVANADNNDVAMINIARKADSAVLGFIPTGWYPSARGRHPRRQEVAGGHGQGDGLATHRAGAGKASDSSA